MANTSNFTGLGLNTDSTTGQIKEGQLTFAKNAIVFSWDGQKVTYQNEPSNIKHFTFPEGFRPIGVFQISQLDKVLYYLTDGTNSEIGYSDKGEAAYHTLMKADFNFQFQFPIHDLVIKTTNCSVEVYWTDGNEPFRYFSFDDLPWVEVPDPNNDYKKIKLEGQVDLNKLLIQAKFTTPTIDVLEVPDGGSVKEGSYQFVAQYSNAVGDGYSSFYNVSNPISIHDVRRATESFDLPTSKSIRIKINNLDTSGLFDYYNLVVIETINAISTPKLLGTYPISNTEDEVLYTGNTEQSIQLSMEQIFQKYTYYDTAEGVTGTDDRVVWYNLKEKFRTNYQQIFAKIPLYWETTPLEGDYADPKNTMYKKGYMRDEVYPLHGLFGLRSGKETDTFPFIGRTKEIGDVELINGEEAWKVRNTAYTIETKDDGSQIGGFAFWESEENYPNNPDIWGDLAAKPIRHFKFPDEAITPRFKTTTGEAVVFPIGIKINAEDVRKAIDESDLTEAEKDEIVYIKVVRGDRSSGNQSIVAKGHFTNVGKYNYQDQDYYFSNYPYNDVGEDPLFAKEEVSPNSGYVIAKVQEPFKDNPLNRLTFHSPDTHFYQPFGIDSGKVKLEAIDYGTANIHFVKVNNQAEYKFTTRETLMVSVGLAAGVAFDYSRKGIPEFNGTDALAVFNSNKELIEKLVPFENMGYNINSTAEFNKSYALPNDVQKLFNIEFGKYVNSEYNTIDEGNLFNNLYRESAVVVKLDEEVQYAHTYSSDIPKDMSRTIGSQRVDLREVTDEEFYTLLLNEDADAATALALSMLTHTYALSDNSSNLALRLFPVLGRILQKAVDIGLPAIYALEHLEDDCDTVNCNPFGLTPFQIDQVPQVVSVVFPYLTIGGESIEVADTMDFTLPYIGVPQTTLCSNENVTIQYFQDNFYATPEQVQQGVDTIGVPTDEIQEDNLLNILPSYMLLFAGTEKILCAGDIASAAFRAFSEAKVVYSEFSKTIEASKDLEKIREREVNAYYGSIKRNLPAQWGRIHSYQLVDTGFTQPIDTPTTFPTVYGGDTFINKFSFKTKQSVYKKHLVGLPDQADISLDEEGMHGYPMFYISTKPIDYDFEFSLRDMTLALGGLGLTNIKAFVGSAMESIGYTIASVGLGTAAVLSGTVIGGVVGLVIAAVGAVIGIVGSLLKNTRSKLTKASMALYKSLFQQIIDQLGTKRINLDISRQRGVAHHGVFYQYVYGIPTYYVESQVNVDYRQATNDREGNYYPRVGDAIPDDWVQQDNVPIINDNTYHYNKSFSKQNKENYFSHLREDFDYKKECFRNFPNRAIWSDQTRLNETLNNWLIYRPSNRFDFPKEYGRLTALDGITNNSVLARFENKSQLYNTMTTIDASNVSVYIGSDQLFSSTPPVDILDTDYGSMGSQNQFLLKTEYGIIYTDAKRGQVILLNGETPRNLADENMSQWFRKNLPFSAKTVFDAYTDNHFTGIGLHGTYDEFFKRLLLTKKDYEIINTDSMCFDGKMYRDISTFDAQKEKAIKEGWKILNTEDCKIELEKKVTNINLPTQTDIYAYFDTTSMLEEDGIVAAEALKSWFQSLKSINPGYEGNLYILPMGVEAWLRHLNITLNANVNTTTTGLWPTITKLPPGWKTPSYKAPKNIIILSFVDEVQGGETIEYHGSTVERFEIPTQPTIGYLTDYEVFQNVRSSFNYFKQVLYPIRRSLVNVFINNVMQMAAALTGKLLTDEEIETLNASVDLTLLKTENPYISLGGLQEQGFSGILDKVSPAEDVFNSSTFGFEITDLLDMGSVETKILKKTITFPEIKVGDPKYFKNISWTLSFSFLTNSWTAWHDYQPNAYIPYTGYFQSITNDEVWNHNQTYNSFCSFYGVQSPYILEYPFNYKAEDEILQSISDYGKSLIYSEFDIYQEPDKTLYFNKALIYNNFQSTGILELTTKPTNNLSSYMGFPKYKLDSKEILISKTDNVIKFNTFWDIVKDKSKPFFKTESIDKVLLPDNLDYSKKPFAKATIRSKDSRVRLILDKAHDYKLLSTFVVTQTQPSKI